MGNSKEKMKELQKESFFSGILLPGTGKPEERKKRKVMFSSKFRVGKYKFDVRDNRKKPMTCPQEWENMPKHRHSSKY